MALSQQLLITTWKKASQPGMGVQGEMTVFSAQEGNMCLQAVCSGIVPCCFPEEQVSGPGPSPLCHHGGPAFFLDMVINWQDLKIWHPGMHPAP